MAEQQLTKRLVKHIDEAFAMEQHVLRVLDSMLKTTGDPQIQREIEQHKMTTRRHAERLLQRLKMHGSSPSRVKQAGGVVGARVKAGVDLARRDKPGRNARDGFVSEQMEVASYELLERVAGRAGDDETAAVARENRAEDEAMAARIASNWDKFVDLSLAGAESKVAGARQRVKGGIKALGQRPLGLGLGSVAAGLLVGRRLVGGGGGQAQAQESQAPPARPQELERLSKQQLLERAKGAGVSTRPEMTKRELIEELTEAGATTKRAAPKERVIVDKETVSDQVEVSAEIRTQRIDIDEGRVPR